MTFIHFITGHRRLQYFSENVHERRTLKVFQTNGNGSNGISVAIIIKIAEPLENKLTSDQNSFSVIHRNEVISSMPLIGNYGFLLRGKREWKWNERFVNNQASNSQIYTICRCISSEEMWNKTNLGFCVYVFIFCARSKITTFQLANVNDTPCGNIFAFRLYACSLLSQLMAPQFKSTAGHTANIHLIKFSKYSEHVDANT